MPTDTARAAAQVPVGPGDYLQVVNNGDRPLKLTWDGRSVTIPAGKAGLATFEQVVNHFGHPAASDTQQKAYDPTGAFHIVPTRDEERRRVQIKQGWDLRSSATGGLQELAGPPPVEIYDPDGNRVWTVVCDPDGEHVMPASGQPGGVAADQIAYMERQLRILKAQLGVDATSGELAVPGATPPADTRPGPDAPGELADLDVPTDD